MLQPIFLNEERYVTSESLYLSARDSSARGSRRSGKSLQRFSQLAGLFANIAEEIKIELKEANDLSRNWLSSSIRSLVVRSVVLRKCFALVGLFPRGSLQNRLLRGG